MSVRFQIGEDDMEMEYIEPIHKDTSLLLKGATADQLRTSLLDFKEPKLRRYVGLYSPEFQMLKKIISNHFRKMKDREKRGVFVFGCCYLFWFGAKPDPCLHILDDGFRSMHDRRNTHPKQTTFETFEAALQDTKDTEDDLMSLMTLDDADHQEDKEDQEAREEFVSTMIKKYAKKSGLLDEYHGYVTLPAIVCCTTGRPESNTHIRCFWSGGPNAVITTLEQEEIDIRTSALYLIERVISTREAVRIVIDCDPSYDLCTASGGDFFDSPYMTLACTNEMWKGLWMIFEKAYGRLPMELPFLHQATFQEEWDQYHFRFFVCKEAYREMEKRHHNKRGIIWQYFLKYRDIHNGDERSARDRKRTTAREIIYDCIEKAFDEMRPKINKERRELLTPHIKAMKSKKKAVLRQRAYMARKNQKNATEEPK